MVWLVAIVSLFALSRFQRRASHFRNVQNYIECGYANDENLCDRFGAAAWERHRPRPVPP